MANIVTAVPQLPRSETIAHAVRPPRASLLSHFATEFAFRDAAGLSRQNFQAPATKRSGYGSCH